MNDKLELQECLEHGRIAKVSLSARAVWWVLGQQAKEGVAELHATHLTSWDGVGA